MRRRLCSLALVAALSPGCLAATTIVKLRPNGSGTVEQTTLVNTKAFESLAMLGGQTAGGDQGATIRGLPSPKDMLDEARLKEAAARLGQGVRFVSVTPLTDGTMEGARAVFAFDDINQLVVDQSPGATSPAGREQVTFRLQRQASGSSLLTVTLPEPEAEAAGERAMPAAPPQQVPPEALALVKPFLEGLRLTVAVDVEGAVVKTSADYVDGARVTLLDVDFAPLLANPAAFQKLSALGPGASLNDIKPLLKDVPGIKVNSSPVTIEFR